MISLSQGCGQSRLVTPGSKRPQLVLFHHSQAWAPPSRQRGHAPILETHTGAEAAEMLQVNNKTKKCRLRHRVIRLLLISLLVLF